MELLGTIGVFIGVFALVCIMLLPAFIALAILWNTYD